MSEFRVLVCGGRNYTNRLLVGTKLGEIAKRQQNIHVVQGGADGADSLAFEWALAHALPVTTYPAKWREHGKKAGSLRNQQMLDEFKPALVVAFPGGRGTADMIRRTKDAGVPLLCVSDASYGAVALLLEPSLVATEAS